MDGLHIVTLTMQHIVSVARKQNCEDVSHLARKLNISKGFNNWKRAKEKFEKHDRSPSQQEASMKYVASNRPSVVTLVNMTSNYGRAEKK